MAVRQLLLFPDEALHPNPPTFWFLMQVGMMLGFATAYPMSWWLINRGIEEVV